MANHARMSAWTENFHKKKPLEGSRGSRSRPPVLVGQTLRVQAEGRALERNQGRARGPAAGSPSASISSVVRISLRIRKRTPSGDSKEKPAPRPGTTSRTRRVCFQYSNWAAPM